MEGVPSTSKEIFKSKYMERTEEKKERRERIEEKSTNKEEHEKEEKKKLFSKREERETFVCCFCKLSEKYDYKGRQPPFQRHLIYQEDCYIMRDPFSPLNQKEALILGGDCCLCKKSTCMDCSIFYTKRFCKICALNNIHDLPSQLHKKIKQFSLHNEKDENTSI